GVPPLGAARNPAGRGPRRAAKPACGLLRSGAVPGRAADCERPLHPDRAARPERRARRLAATAPADDEVDPGSVAQRHSGPGLLRDHAAWLDLLRDGVLDLSDRTVVRPDRALGRAEGLPSHPGDQTRCRRGAAEQQPLPLLVAADGAATPG